MDALLIDRLQFVFTISFHYLFPQLTMGLALLIVILKYLAVKKKNEHYNKAARFWAKIFGINFAMGVVTGIPMEFQFGTNWARFSTFAGGVIGQTLAMEGMFAFFLESSFLGLFLYGEKKLGQVGHLISAILIFVGSWLSGYFIIATNAWMQHPVGYAFSPDGSVHLTSFWELILNPWAVSQYAHNMIGAVVTATFVMMSVGAYYLLSKRDLEYGKTFIRTGMIAGLISTIFLAFPTGDFEAKNVATHQGPKFAAMEGLFETKQGAELVIIGQPDMEKLRLDNPLHVPNLLSFLTYNRWNAEVKGLDAFPRSDWPDNIPLLYYSYHIMVGLGTIFISIMILSIFLYWKKKLFESRWVLWILLLSFPFPYIANTAGWMTSEIGRQPWLVYGLMRTDVGTSATVSAGNGLFTLLGFLGIYFLLGVLFILLVIRTINNGPSSTTETH
ncbi:MAG: cytochrome ubiquinol oxidase subunit I [Ignavibacteriales bacterium]|nr:cytochrome ubiquinol oxidase subunit I [Ignavibacteriales bacterium]